MVNGAPIQGDDFTWSSTLNLNYNKNEILALSDTNADVYLYDGLVEVVSFVLVKVWVVSGD